MQLDPHFVDIGLAILINLATQVAKPFHTNPFTVFKVIAFILCVIYAVVSHLGYKEQLTSMVGSVITIVGLASGFWHLAMRPEGPLMQWWNNRKKAAL